MSSCIAVIIPYVVRIAPASRVQGARRWPGTSATKHALGTLCFQNKSKFSVFYGDKIGFGAVAQPPDQRWRTVTIICSVGDFARTSV